VLVGVAASAPVANCEEGQKGGTYTRRDGATRCEEASRSAGGRPPCGRNETEGTVNVGRKDRTASEALNRFERVARAIQERARRLEILDRRALARREAEDRRLQEAERR
jgi:hypothetical protein